MTSYPPTEEESLFFMNFNIKLKFILATVKHFNLRACVPNFLIGLVVIFAWSTEVKK